MTSAPSLTITVLSHVIGFVFAISVAAKLRSMDLLVEGVRNHGLVGGRLVKLAAFSVIAGEIVVAVSHLAIFALPIMVAVAACLLIIFLIYTAILLTRGENLKCLCFGANRDENVSGYTIARIAVLLLMEVTLLTFIWIGVNAKPENFANFVSSLIAAASIVVLANWWLVAPDLLIWWRLRPTRKAREDSVHAVFDPMRQSTELFSQL